MTTPPQRPWRLRGYRGKEVAYDKVLPDDRALDEALRRLERDPEITRTAATPH